MRRRVAFHTLGCKVNQYDTQVLVRLFRERGYEVVDFDGEADIYIINTCTVTATGDRKSRQAIRRAIKRNPGAIVAVTGCYAQTEPESVLEIDGVDVVVGVNQRSRIVDLVEEKMREREGETPGEVLCRVEPLKGWDDRFETLEAEVMRERVRAYIKIQDGCEYFCSYCRVPYARGPMRSRDLDSILAEAERLSRSGIREVVLTGIHLGAYGKEKGGGVSLADVLSRLHDLPGLERIRLSSIEPMDISVELLKTMEGLPKVCRHLHIPLQSGDDMILKAMRRTYTTGEFRVLVDRIREGMPECGITTDVIVGFPGETEESFARTYRFVKEMGFSRLHVFRFSKRPGTPAASFPDQVAPGIKNMRMSRLIALGRSLSLSFHQRFVGKDVKVLIERFRDDKHLAEGLTGNYIRVWAPGTPADLGRLVSINVRGADVEGMWGRIET